MFLIKKLAFIYFHSLGFTLFESEHLNINTNQYKIIILLKSLKRLDKLNALHLQIQLLFWRLGATFVFDIYDFTGDGTIDAVNLGDCLRALNQNPTLASIEKLGGTKKKSKLNFARFLSTFAVAKLVYPCRRKETEVGRILAHLQPSKEGQGTRLIRRLPGGSQVVRQRR